MTEELLLLIMSEDGERKELATVGPGREKRLRNPAQGEASSQLAPCFGPVLKQS